MSTRRSFLQWLGIGSIVAPIGAEGLLQPAVKIVEPAKVEPAAKMPSAGELDALSFLSNPATKGTIQVLFRTNEGQVLSFAASAFVSDARVTYGSGGFAQPPIALYTEHRWQMEGYLMDQWKRTTE